MLAFAGANTLPRFVVIPPGPAETQSRYVFTQTVFAPAGAAPGGATLSRSSCDPGTCLAVSACLCGISCVVFLTLFVVHSSDLID